MDLSRSPEASIPSFSQIWGSGVNGANPSVRQSTISKEKGSRLNRLRDSIEEHCSDVRSEGREAVVACMESHKDDLSSECAEQADKMLTQ